MKALYTLLFAVLLTLSVTAQEDPDAGTKETIEELNPEKDALREQGAAKDTSYWKWGGFGTFNFGQVALINWTQGGNSSISATLLGNIYADFKKDKHLWTNTFDAQWGIQKIKDQQARKNVDIMELNSKYGYQLTEKVYASSLLNFRSQFSRTWAFDEETNERLNPHISRFMSPATLQLGLGIDYVPNEWFSVYISPATGKFTFVLDSLVDETVYGLDAGNTVRAEFGAYLRAQFNKEVFKNVAVRSTLELFNNYTDKDKGNRKNIDVNWQTGIDMSINEWLVTSLFLHLIYDHNQAVPKVDDNGDPVFLEDPETGQVYDVQQNTVLTQFRQAFSLGLTYRFGDPR